MRLLLALLLATAVSAGEAADPMGERIAARGRDPLPAAWSAWFELSWGELPDGLAEEQIPTAQLPQAVLLTLE